MPKLVSSWNELKECKSETHTLEIKDCSGWIEPKDLKDANSFEGCHYLSTHTFYGHQYEDSTKILQACGFDVEIFNWDAEEGRA